MCLDGERNGLVAAPLATQAGRAAEREAAPADLITEATGRETRLRRLTPGRLQEPIRTSSSFTPSLRARLVGCRMWPEVRTHPKWPSFLTDEERKARPVLPSARRSGKLVEQVRRLGQLDRAPAQVPPTCASPAASTGLLHSSCRPQPAEDADPARYPRKAPPGESCREGRKMASRDQKQSLKGPLHATADN